MNSKSTSSASTIIEYSGMSYVTLQEFKYDAQPKQKHHFIAKEFKNIKKKNIYVDSCSLPK